MKFPLSAAAMLAAIGAPPATAPVTAQAAGHQPRAHDVRWRIEAVELEGNSRYRLDDGERRYELDGEVVYRTRAPLKGKPVALRRGTTVSVTVERGIEWSTTNTGVIASKDATWDCAFSRTDPSAGLGGIFVVRRQRVDVQWSLAPAYLQCQPDAPRWDFDPLPIQAMSSRFKLSSLDARRRRINIPIDIVHRWTDSYGTRSEVLWLGSVSLGRVL